MDGERERVFIFVWFCRQRFCRLLKNRIQIKYQFILKRKKKSLKVNHRIHGGWYGVRRMGCVIILRSIGMKFFN